MSNQNPKFLTVKEVAEWFKVNPMTVYRKAIRGELPAIKFGRQWLFPEDALKEWISSQISTNKEKASDVLNNSLSVLLAKLPQIKLVYLFGSIATGMASPLSDIDIAYLDDGSMPAFDLEAKLEEIILNKFPDAPRIDLVRLNDAPIEVQYRAIRDGKLIFASSDKTEADFEELVINHYLDYAPVITSFYHETLENIKEAT